MTARRRDIEALLHQHARATAAVVALRDALRDARPPDRPKADARVAAGIGGSEQARTKKQPDSNACSAHAYTTTRVEPRPPWLTGVELADSPCTCGPMPQSEPCPVCAAWRTLVNNTLARRRHAWRQDVMVADCIALLPPRRRLIDLPPWSNQ